MMVSQKTMKRTKTRKAKKKGSDAYKLCSCIKNVSRRLSTRKRPNKGKREPPDESTAIKICVYNLLTRKNKRLHSFRCKKENNGPWLRLQPASTKKRRKRRVKNKK